MPLLNYNGEGTLTVPAGAVSLTTAHGCDGVPSSIWLQPLENIGGRNYWVDHTTITATQFTAYISSVSLTDLSFRFICQAKTSGNTSVPAGSTSIIVSHGHVGTPKNVWVVPREDVEGRRYWVDYSSIGFTKFTLHISSLSLVNDYDFRFMCDTYLTSGNSTVLLLTTSRTVTHGYGSKPNSVWLQPKDNLGGRTHWVSDINSTTFKINISGVDFVNHDFRWMCSSYTPPTFKFICCPGSRLKNGQRVPCGEVIHLERIGPAGQRGVKDSRMIKCDACGIIFRAPKHAETYREANGALE